MKMKETGVGPQSPPQALQWETQELLDVSAVWEALASVRQRTGFRFSADMLNV